MSNPRSRKSCVVPKCTNTTTKTPEKLFFVVPMNLKLRKKWIKAMKRLDPISEKSTVYCCEDHFDVEEDMENYIKFKLVGGILKLKKGVLPHKFDCRNPGKKTIVRSAYKKRRDIEYFERLLSKDIGHEDLLMRPIEVVECKNQEPNIDQDSDYVDMTEEIDVLSETNEMSQKTQAVQGNTLSTVTDEGKVAASKSQKKSKRKKSTARKKQKKKIDNKEDASATQSLVVPEARDIIYNVYHYLLNEYKNMKRSFASTGCDLSPLADILKRTAEATGANQEAVSKILKRRKRSRGSKLNTASKKRPKLADYVDDDDISPTEEDSSSKVKDDEELAEDHNGANDVGQIKPMKPVTVKIEIEPTEQMDPLRETLKVEIDEEHLDRRETAEKRISPAYLKTALSRSTTAVQYLSRCSLTPTLNEVKLEPPDEDLQSTDQTKRCVNLANDMTSDPLDADTPSTPPPH